MSKGITIGIIPARGGSKGIKDKNIIDLCGKPMIAYTIEAATASKVLDDIILSTDSEKITAVSEQFGLKAKSLRPTELSSDTAQTIDVVKYEIQNYETENKVKVGTVVLLQPTAPLRRVQDIIQSLNKYKQSKMPSLISCYEATGTHPRIMYTEKYGLLSPLLSEGNNIIRRQDMEKIYVRNGAIYITDRDYLFAKNRLVSETCELYEMPLECSVNIDSAFELRFAEYLLHCGQKK